MKKVLHPLNQLWMKLQLYPFAFQNISLHLGISVGMLPANERRHYNVTTPLIGWAHTYTDPCSLWSLEIIYGNILLFLTD